MVMEEKEGKSEEEGGMLFEALVSKPLKSIIYILWLIFYYINFLSILVYCIHNIHIISSLFCTMRYKGPQYHQLYS